MKPLVISAILATILCIVALAIAQQPEPAPLASETAETVPVAESSAPVPGPGTGAPAASPMPEADLDTASDLVKALRAGHYREAFGLALILIVGLLLRWGKKIPKVGPWFGTDEGGVVFAFGAAALGALGLSLIGDGPVDLTMFRAAFVVGVLATGGYSVLWKKLVKPLGKRLLTKLGWIG